MIPFDAGEVSASSRIPATAGADGTEWEADVTSTRLRFSTKASTLSSLKGRLQTAAILPAYVVDAESWLKQPERVLDGIESFEGLSNEVIVRSSAALEDSAGASQAGKFSSCRAIKSRPQLTQAISRVFASYGTVSSSDQVLVQRYLSNSRMSGVAFNRDPHTHALYDTINYTLTSNTALVTSGIGDNPKLYVASRWAPHRHREPFAAIILLLRELEELFGSVPIDVEFAVDEGGALVLLQVRALAGSPESSLAPDAQHKAIEEAASAVARLLSPQPDVLGRRSLLGIMPDWNPAEIIGVRPRPLAFSLYRLLITDAVWACYRHKYGYRDTRNVPLMVSVHGLPYIDVRASFNSFLPATLPDDVAERLVNACIERLAENPHLHDKVEFEIMPSCYTFVLHRKLDALAGLSRDDRSAIVACLHRLTNSFFVGKAERQIRIDRDKIGRLIQRQAADARHEAALITRLHRVIADCRRYGSGPFSGLARAAFVATDMLRAAVSEGAVSEAESAALFSSLDTPTSRFMSDLRRLDRQSLIEKYGHLRPGTYDIRVPTYAEAPGTYLDGALLSEERERASWAPSARTQALLDARLSAHGIAANATRFFDFVAAATEAREMAKFVFTRSLSTALSIIGELGETRGFSRDELSYVDVRDILDLRVHSWDLEDTLARSVALGYARSQQTNCLSLPPLIASADDVWCFDVLASRPNFVTKQLAEARVRFASDSDLEGAIVLIPNADPGFDWLFGKGVAGLVTAYGGCNSHMAIRAAELRLPAVIGAGQTLFDMWSRARRLRIDCGSERVEVVA